MAARATADEIHQVISIAVDGAFYRAVYPDVAGAGLDPVSHYVENGWREGRDPAPWFSTRAYLDADPRLAKAGWNPLHHYLTAGRREGREVIRSAEADRYLLARARAGQEPAWSFESLTGVQDADALAEAAAEQHRQRQVAAAEFDSVFYLRANKDVAEAGADPLDHFLANGWREGRDPNADFSVKDYLETYPDIAAAGVNPFVHYLDAGRTEGRSARVELGFRYDILKHIAPIEARLGAVKRADARLKLGTLADLAKGLGVSRTGLADLYLTFSHDDYTANTGGVQLCLQREDARIAARGTDHLHIYPAKPWPVVRLHDEGGALGVLLNGQRLGVFAPKTLQTALRKAAGPAKASHRSFAIHSLLGHNVGETLDILGAVDAQAGYFWLHDFASLCAGFHLLRNDVEDCAAPPADSMACGVCVYGPWRARHVAEHERLFERLSLTVVSPSQPTLDLWTSRSAYVAKATIVLPHARLVERGPAPTSPGVRPLRVAYAGMPTAHKGWNVFRDLAARYAGDPRYHFLQLGGRAGAASIEFHKVTVTEAQPRAMQDAIERLDADVVLVWPLCRETFSFIAYEAVAAGAVIVTSPHTGNVAAFVADGDHGRVVADEIALAQMFESGEIAALSREARAPMLFDLAFSGLTVELLESGAAESRT